VCFQFCAIQTLPLRWGSEGGKKGVTKRFIKGGGRRKKGVVIHMRLRIFKVAQSVLTCRDAIKTGIIGNGIGASGISPWTGSGGRKHSKNIPIQPLVGQIKRKKCDKPTRRGNPALAGLTIVPVSMVSKIEKEGKR